jgi:hypothetical protein
MSCDVSPDVVAEDFTDVERTLCSFTMLSLESAAAEDETTAKGDNTSFALSFPDRVSGNVCHQRKTSRNEQSAVTTNAIRCRSA